MAYVQSLDEIFDRIRADPRMWLREKSLSQLEAFVFGYSMALQAHDIAIEDHSHTFNTELTVALELSYMLDVAGAIIQSALQRQESRGSHQRTDFPKRDDEKYLAHSLAYRNEDGSTRIEYLPVTITRWPPGERVYGR